MITKAQIIENSAVVLLARVADEDGNYIKQADVSSITIKVFNKTTGTQVTPAPTIAVADVVYDTLQQDARWSVDRIGYNLAIVLGGANFPDGGVTYRVEIKVTPAEGSAFYLVWDLQAVDLLSE